MNACTTTDQVLVLAEHECLQGQLLSQLLPRVADQSWLLGILTLHLDGLQLVNSVNARKEALALVVKLPAVLGKRDQICLVNLRKYLERKHNNLHT